MARVLLWCKLVQGMVDMIGVQWCRRVAQALKRDGGDNSVWSQGSKLLGKFGISLNENFIQSNQNVRGAGSAPRIQWTLSGLVLIRGGAFEGLGPIDPWYPPYSQPSSIWGIHHITRRYIATFCCRLELALIQLYCCALLPWIGLGAVASDRGRRYCVKGFGVPPPCMYLSPIYICSRWGWRGIEAQYSDRQQLWCLSSTYSAPFYQHTYM